MIPTRIGALTPEEWRLGHARRYLHEAASDLRDLANKFQQAADAIEPGKRNIANVLGLIRTLNNAVSNLALSSAIEAAAEADAFQQFAEAEEN